MTIKIAINGYGRIGRNILRALYERQQRTIQIVAINDLGDTKTNVHLTCYDTTHGKFPGTVDSDGDYMLVNGDRILTISERDPKQLPWAALDVDVVYECTGLFTQQEQAAQHLSAGAKRVIISAPAGKEVDATIVYGVNQHCLKATDRIISNASCTTNCLALLAQPLQAELGIMHGLMTTIHAYTNDQVLVDVYHSDWRRARSATHSMIPTKTGAAAAVGLVLPALAGKLDGLAVRVPILNVSLVDFSFQAKRSTSATEVNQILKQASQTRLQGLLEYNEAALVSVDFNHNPASAIVDASQTRVIDDFVKVLAWYDNEWGFSNRMLDVTIAWMQCA